MKLLRNLLDKQEENFLEGGKFEKLYPLYETIDTFLYTPSSPTKSASHIRDVMDLKRMMMTVVIALIPAVLMALYNTGLQANLGIQTIGASSTHWQAQVIDWLGLGHDPSSLLGNMVFGALYFLPVYMVTLAVGGFWEVLFAIVRKHEVNEGFLVTSLLFPLILPPNIPYWQVALGISFGVVIGKEVFGGVGMNILNPALVARAFLFFAYPAQISGDKVWVAIDGLSQATPLAQFADKTMAVSYSWMDSFLGFIPGSMGETSALACLIGAVILISSKVGSWKIMLSVVVGTVVTTLALNAMGSSTNPMFDMPFYWHFVIGGFAFGAVFMATDPVSATMTETGKYIYGFFIGFFVVLVRVVNPAFPEGMMLAILFMNVFAPIIDRYFINKNIKRRLARNVV
ncbi:MAG: NADH:ubiquinone reductase (Na(+)-transporting) subunit B [Melioribacteraceae bacterium]|nr:NADH:ubiquinone reductase (Na(+)-transporting) subunit B [Melioribacteraceae bacterium]MCF8263167.1 NADH:ubiquinone reductase (Na(+)-transporting) subunit B [Melioribacteraceae bacterium]MCF8413277.1 NADH:ubiquinone reductase (Na(+)-transporting) subunit B [Melioribacteraceae bacterium]MCF8430345.1 NADH:ubiquinone reductase (Na(+)-transporting) subunit B [Melioribacteraceae bacterium]